MLQTEHQGTWVKVTVEREGTENLIAYIKDERYFADPMIEGDRIIARWTIESVHPLAHVGAEDDVSRLYGEDFSSTPAYLES